MEVVRQPRVVIVTTGDELAKPSEELLPGQIYNSNGIMLTACCEALGAEVDHIHVPDDLDATIGTFREAAESADFIVVAGGVSVGDRDFVQDALQAAGGVVDFWRIRVKPGKPFSFWSTW